MTTIRIEDLQRDPLGYLHKVETGETLIVLRADKPVAEIKPPSTVAKSLRPYGLCAGEFVVPDDFDELLPEEFLRQFEGS